MDSGHSPLWWNVSAVSSGAGREAGPATFKLHFTSHAAANVIFSWLLFSSAALRFTGHKASGAAGAGGQPGGTAAERSGGCSRQQTGRLQL